MIKSPSTFIQERVLSEESKGLPNFFPYRRLITRLTNTESKRMQTKGNVIFLTE